MADGTTTGRTGSLFGAGALLPLSTHRRAHDRPHEADGRSRGGATISARGSGQIG